MVGFRVRNKVRKRLKRIALENSMTFSGLIESVLTGYVRGDFSYENEEEQEDLSLSERADNASIELDSILSDVQFLELEDLAFDAGTIQQSTKELDRLAEAVRDSDAEFKTWLDNQEEE